VEKIMYLNTPEAGLVCNIPLFCKILDDQDGLAAYLRFFNGKFKIFIVGRMEPIDRKSVV